MRSTCVPSCVLLASALAAAGLLAACDGAQKASSGPAAPAAECTAALFSGPIFNGTDLSGWVKVNCWDDTFQAKDGMLFCTGNPTGFLRTDRMYENFVLEFDWKHEKEQGNAGLFVWSDPIPSQAQNMFPRSVEVQIMLTPDVSDKQGRLLSTGQGDVFSIWGAKMTPLREHPAGWERTLPSERVTKGAGEWNHYKVTGRNGDLTVEINGVEVSGARACSPRMGYICLESEGSPVWFRNITVRELAPAGDIPAEARADDGTGLRPMFDGKTLAGWREEKGQEGHWKLEGGVLKYDGKGSHLWSTEELDDFELVCDWRWTKDHQGKMMRPVIGPDGAEVRNPDGSVKQVEVEERDSGIYLRGQSKSQVNMWLWPCGSGEIWGYRTDASMPAAVRAACTPKVAADRPIGEWNRFRILVVGDTVTVTLNGKNVIDRAHLPGMPRRGPIALQSHGCPVEFQNVFVRPLGRESSADERAALEPRR
ncbi:MAG: DUF1080 domain-containing protein [Phycisphaerales bacterium]